MSSEEAARAVFDELKKKYPTLSDEAIQDIMQTGANRGLITVTPEPAAETATPEEESGDFEILKILKSGDADLDQVMRFMVIDNYIKERFGKGKELPPEVKEALEKLKSSKSPESDFDRFMDKMLKWEATMSFMDRLGGKKRNGEEDLGKEIRDMGEKMANALREHKLEDEKARAEEREAAAKKKIDELENQIETRRRTEEDEKRLEAKVKERTAPLEEKYKELMAEIGDKLRNVNPEERKGMLLDLGEMISDELGDEIKDRIIDGIKSSFGGGEKDSSSVVLDDQGKARYDLFKLGERGLKTLEKLIERMPTGAPPRREVKEMTSPRLPTSGKQPEKAETATETKVEPKEETSRATEATQPIKKESPSKVKAKPVETPPSESPVAEQGSAKS
jgi:hypothetical protein